MSHWRRIAAFVLAAAAVVPMVLRAGQEGAGSRPNGESKTAGTPLFEVKPGKLGVNVEEWGIVEAVSTADVFYKNEGTTTIVSILPEGTRVAKGQLVCELDSSALRDQLFGQEIATRGADAKYQNARLTREVAELAMTEYLESTYPQEHRTIAGRVEIAQAGIGAAQARLEHAQGARKRMDSARLRHQNDGFPTDVMAELTFDDYLAEAMARVPQRTFELEAAKLQLEILEKFTKRKTTNQLQSTIEKARSDELAKQQLWDLEKVKEKKRHTEIENCKLLAPGDGPVVYANTPGRIGTMMQPQIEEGAVVRERQRVFSIPDPNGPLRLNVKVREPYIHWITPGLSAQIEVEGLPGQALTGVVERVFPLPDPTPYLSDQTRVYTTLVRLEQRPDDLALGMTAEVKFATQDLENVMSVPVSSVVYYDGRDHVAVKKADGGFDWRDVSLGQSTGSMVEVKQGLASGASIALEPAPLLSGGQKLRIAHSPARPARPPRGAAKGPTPASAAAKGVTIGSPEIKAKFLRISPDDRQKLRDASPQERAGILKKAGFTDDEIRALSEMREKSAPR